MSANICVTRYDGDFDVSFECSEKVKKSCKNYLAHEMGGEREEDCTYSEYSTCKNKVAHIDTLESLVDRLNKRRREIEEELEE